MEWDCWPTFCSCIRRTTETENSLHCSFDSSCTSKAFLLPSLEQKDSEDSPLVAPTAERTG